MILVSQQASAGQYQHAQFATADRGRLLLLMFDGALRFLAQAESALQSDRIEEFVDQLGRAQAVIAELLRDLTARLVIERVQQLDRLYRFMLEHLVEANVQKSPRHVAQVRHLMTTIADSYREILAQGMPQLGARDAA